MSFSEGFCDTCPIKELSNVGAFLAVQAGRLMLKRADDAPIQQMSADEIVERFSINAYTSDISTAAAQCIQHFYGSQCTIKK